MAGLYNISSMLGGSSSSFYSNFYSNLSQYGSIKTGAYRKALTAYYEKVEPKQTHRNDKSDKTNQSERAKTTRAYTRTSKYSTKNAKVAEQSLSVSETKTAASDLVNAAKKLTSTGKDSLFAKKNYDADAVYKAANNFVSEYNDTVDALSKTTNSSVKNTASSMSRMTNVMSNSLSKIGISVGDNGKLAIDETVFKAADQKKVKSMLNGSGSYADMISSSASRVVTQAGSQINQLNGGMYGSSGYYNGYVDSMFNSFF